MIKKLVISILSLSCLMVVPALASTSKVYKDEETIKSVQEDLAELGYYFGEIDGVINKSVTDSIIEFQKDNDLMVSGNINDDVINALDEIGNSETKLNNSPLTRDDFLLYIENDNSLENYGNDVVDYINAELGPESYMYYFSSKDYEGENIGEVKTYRNIVIEESTKDDLIDAYGIGVSQPFDKSTDLIFDSMTYNNDENIIYFENTRETIFYNYNSASQIIFFINQEDIVSSVAFTNVIIYTADQNTTQYVQEALNSYGYNCGEPDGIYGSNTENAILQYQKDNNLYESGVIDDQLLKSLNEKGYNETNSSSNNAAKSFIPVTNFVNRYNEAIEYYNAIAERDGYNAANTITESIVTGSETFSPDGALELCVNPNSSEKTAIDTINIFSENTNNIDTYVATGEVMAMFYAFDQSMTEVSEALDMWTKINEEMTVDNNGVIYKNYSAGSGIIIVVQYK